MRMWYTVSHPDPVSSGKNAQDVRNLTQVPSCEQGFPRSRGFLPVGGLQIYFFSQANGATEVGQFS